MYMFIVLLRVTCNLPCASYAIYCMYCEGYMQYVMQHYTCCNLCASPLSTVCHLISFSRAHACVDEHPHTCINIEMLIDTEHLQYKHVDIYLCIFSFCETNSQLHMTPRSDFSAQISSFQLCQFGTQSQLVGHKTTHNNST